jgi:thiamine pyrophosphate-dependent acetolactate synthase large subunit-like protein
MHRACRRHYEPAHRWPKHLGRDVRSGIESPDCAACARSFGARGWRIEDPADLADAYNEALRCQQPAIIDVVAGPTYAYPDYQAMLQVK